MYLCQNEYWHAVWILSLKCMVQSMELKCNKKVTVTISLPNLFWSRAWCDVASLLQGQSRVSLLSGVTSWHLLCWSSHNICNASHGKLDNGVEIMIFNGCIKGVDNEPDLFWHFTNWLCIRVCCLCPLPMETKKNQVHCPPLVHLPIICGVLLLRPTVRLRHYWKWRRSKGMGQLIISR